jgi:hypothetical protein
LNDVFHWSLFAYENEPGSPVFKCPFLSLLLPADLAFIGLNLLHLGEYLGDPDYSISRDRGFDEVYQYIKLFWIACILSYFALEKRQAIYSVGALLFTYPLIDDSFRTHEVIRGRMVEWIGLEPAFGLRALDYGELIVSATAGLIFLTLGWLASQHSNPLARQRSLYLLGGILALAACGVIVDMLHQLIASRSPVFEEPLVVLEDGGELIVTSVICWFVYSSANQELLITDTTSASDTSRVQ